MKRRPSVSTALAAGAALSLLGATAFGAAATPAAAASVVPTKTSPSATARAAAIAALGGTQKVIVVLRNQHTAVPATAALASRRAVLLAGDQKPLVASLTAAGATKIRTYRTINALAATVSGVEAARLAADPAVSEVIPDSTITLSDPVAAATGVRPAAAAAAGTTPKPRVCAPAGKVQLNPEALQTTHTASDTKGALTARSLGATGAGVKVAYIAEGIDINNPDFIRANGQHVFVDYKDFSGEGTNAPTGGGEAFLDASSVAAQGRRVYDVSHYSALPLNRACLIRVQGVAPGAALVGLKVFGVTNLALTSQFLQAIDYAVAVDHVDVLNESFGSNPFPDRANDALRLFDDAAVAAGTTVVASSGDAGVTNTIGSPASDPDVIAAGASTTFRIYQQFGMGLTRASGATGWLSNNISSLSSSGATEAGRTVDLVAPGDLNWALCTPDPTRYADCLTPTRAPASVTDSGGTSESAPLTAGAAALVIQAFRATHRGASPTPAQIKTILTGTADDIVAPAEQQGAGLLDTYKAVLAARSFPTSRTRPKRVGANLLPSINQIDAVQAPETGVTRRVTVTNIGAGTQTVTITSRALGAYTRLLTTRAVLGDATSRTTTEVTGLRYDYKVVHFDVPAGVGRLDASIAYTAPTGASVRLSLIDPAGRLAGYTLPQGLANYGDTQVANPRAGRWSAYLETRTAANGGTTGPVVFGVRTAKFASIGRVTPSVLRIASGKSAAFTYTATTPVYPGDATTSLVLHASSGAVHKTTTVPVVLRSLLPVRTKQQSFTATLTGGNGRSGFTGVTGYYQLSVPGGTPELNARVTLPVTTNPFSAYLVSPTGQTVAYAGSELLSVDSGLTPVAVDGRAVQLHVLKPAAGRWDLVIDFAPTVAGDVLSQTYTVEADGAAVPVSSTDLPRRATTTLRAGRPTTVHITVHNTGSAPEAFFLDPRKNVNAVYALAVAPATVTLPLTPAVPPQTVSEPSFLVPTNTTTLAARVTSTGPVTFDMGADFGDPDINAVHRGNIAVARISSNPLTQGGWFLGPNEIGPYGTAAAPARPATAAAAVVTKAFDPTVTSPGGDLWLRSIDATAMVTPVIVSPGATAVLTATITPTGKVGTTARGTLYVDDANVLNVGNLAPNGNQVATLPYSYTVRR